MMEHQLRGREMAQQGSELAASLREQPQVIHLATRKNLLCIKLGVVLQMVSIALLARGNSVPGPLVLGMMSPRTELCGGKCPHCPPPSPPFRRLWSAYGLVACSPEEKSSLEGVASITTNGVLGVQYGKVTQNTKSFGLRIYGLHGVILMHTQLHDVRSHIIIIILEIGICSK